jgi:glycosyltransferase involved in cell wall biosynthesis
MPDKISIVIPARNEAETVGKVVAAVVNLPCVGEVVVVDTASWDRTAEAAASAGAVVVDEPELGMGRALKTGYAAAKCPWVMKLDADLEEFDPQLVLTLVEAREPGVGLVKGSWHDPNDDMPMTRLLVRPAIRQIFPGLQHVRAVNSGIYLFNRDLIELDALVDTNAADIDVMLRVHEAGKDVVEVEIGRIDHNPRNVEHYNLMAENILRLFLQHYSRQIMSAEIVT